MRRTCDCEDFPCCGHGFAEDDPFDPYDRFEEIRAILREYGPDVDE